MKKIIIISVFLFTLLFAPLSHASAIGLNNRVNEMSDSEKENIRLILSACADIMRFDRGNYDFDTLMKYILCTHANFAVVSNLSPEASVSGTSADGISIVNGDYIDNIITNIFKLTPQHPPVNALVERGYCYSNGLYYYKNIFNAFFHTQIQDITEIYSLGGGIYYVVFNDIYYENDTVSNEQSFAVIQKNDSLPYSLIRLGMGEKLLTQTEIIAYTPQKTYQSPRWEAAPDYIPSRRLSMPTLIIVIASSIVIFIFGSAALIRELRRK